MKQLLWLLKWILKAAIFFTLLAFALNNQHEAGVHFFFGTQWRAPQVLIVLTAFALGVAVGALAMVPRWWKHRSRARTPVESRTEPSRPAANSPTSTHGF